MLKRILWNANNDPVLTTVDNIMDSLRNDDIADGLLYDAPTMDDILSGENLTILDGIVVNYVRLKAKMLAMKRVMNARANEEQQVVGDPIISDPFMRLGTAQVAVLFQLKDGQAITIYFHNPDSDPKKIKPSDPLVSFKFLLNKKDVTIVVAAEKGREINVREVAMRVMKLANKNSAAFLRQNKKAAERKAMIEDLTKTIETKKATLVKKLKEIETLEAVQEQVKIDSELQAKEQAKANEEFDKQAVTIIKEVKEYAESQGYFINQKAFKNNQLYVYDNKENKGSFLNVVVFDMGEEKGSKHYYEIQEYINFALKGHDINSHAEAKELAFDIINRKKEFDKIKAEQEEINQFTRQFQPEVNAELQAQKENGEEQNLKKAVETVKRKQLELEELRKQRTPEEMERFEGYKAQAQTLKDQLSILFKNSLNKVDVSLENDTTDGNYIIYATGKSKEGTFNIKINTGESTTGGFVATLFSTEQVDYERTQTYSNWADLLKKEIIPFIDKYVPKNENGEFDVLARKTLKEIEDFAIYNGYLSDTTNQSINTLILETLVNGERVGFLDIFVPDMDSQLFNTAPRMYEIYSIVGDNPVFYKAKNHKEAKQLAFTAIKNQMVLDGKDIFNVDFGEFNDSLKDSKNGSDLAKAFYDGLKAMVNTFEKPLTGDLIIKNDDISNVTLDINYLGNSTQIKSNVKPNNITINYVVDGGGIVPQDFNNHFDALERIKELIDDFVRLTDTNLELKQEEQPEPMTNKTLNTDQLNPQLIQVKANSDVVNGLSDLAVEYINALSDKLKKLEYATSNNNEMEIAKIDTENDKGAVVKLKLQPSTRIDKKLIVDTVIQDENFKNSGRIKIVKNENLTVGEFDTVSQAMEKMDELLSDGFGFDVNNASEPQVVGDEFSEWVIDNSDKLIKEIKETEKFEDYSDEVKKLLKLEFLTRDKGGFYAFLSNFTLDPKNFMAEGILQKVYNALRGSRNFEPMARKQSEVLEHFGLDLSQITRKEFLAYKKQFKAEKEEAEKLEKESEIEQSQDVNKYKESMEFLNDVISNNVDVTKDESLERLEKSVNELMADPNYETEYKSVVEQAVEAFAKLTDTYSTDSDNA